MKKQLILLLIIINPSVAMHRAYMLLNLLESRNEVESFFSDVTSSRYILLQHAIQMAPADRAEFLTTLQHEAMQRYPDKMYPSFALGSQAMLEQRFHQLPILANQPQAAPAA